MPAIEFRNVSYSRPGSAPVLNHFDLSIESGEVMALVGRSGAGKTTVLKLVNRLLLPQAGHVLVEGKDTRDWDRDPASPRGRLCDSGRRAVSTHERGRQHRRGPAAGGMERGSRGGARHRAARAHRAAAGVYAERWPHELSGGQRQRVGVARALAADPPVLLMDEPFGALDPVTRAELQDEFRRIQARVRKTVIIVTHDMSEALKLADRLGVIEEGRLIACDRPDAIVKSDDPRVGRLLDAVITRPLA